MRFKEIGEGEMEEEERGFRFSALIEFRTTGSGDLGRGRGRGGSSHGVSSVLEVEGDLVALGWLGQPKRVAFGPSGGKN